MLSNEKHPAVEGRYGELSIFYTADFTRLCCGSSRVSVAIQLYVRIIRVANTESR